ncbi:hypothetical protein [Curtobacterium caseinilyticum]|uniref:Permease n=1 Tax=Curtobacterium caseinilyticum TaxID=3055137 RepID=A0ABT7TP75_9MICO|nr:hypothetical protein [Curtobacterium caseinilyticum]MDM7891395.1 hypothetical protein [Curtobacterium caseinilyticum]
MAAVLALSAALAVSVVREVEALGLLAGRMTLELTELPVGETKAEHVRDITAAAERSSVRVSLLVPDRHGRPGVWTAYSFRGTAAQPGIGASIRPRPIGDGGTLDLLGPMAVDGDDGAMRRFTEVLWRTGYTAVDTTPAPVEALAVVLTRPTVVLVAAAVLLGLAIALIAESRRRSGRQDLRSRAGWSTGSVACAEALDLGRVAGPMVVIACAAPPVALAVHGAGAPTLRFTTIVVLMCVLAAMLIALVLHVGCALLSAASAHRAEESRWQMVLVAAAGMSLVVVAVADVQFLQDGQRTTAEAERTLVAEAAHGDDVVLGTASTTLEQDHALGAIATAALARGDASMAYSSFTDRFTLVGDASASLRALVPGGLPPHGQPLLLVPDALAGESDALRDAAAADIATGWQVEGRPPPRSLDVRLRQVGSTAAVTQSAILWTNGIEPLLPTWPDIPVLVVPDPSDLAPNQIGTGAANGEVRFADRVALEHQLRAAGLTDIVLQVDRVGARVERQLGELRAERHTLLLAVVAAGLALVLAAISLAGEHRVRTARPGRVQYLVGRHPLVPHRWFLVCSGCSAFATAAVTSALIGARGEVILVAGVASGAGALVLVGVVLAAGSARAAEAWRRTW